ncbi:MAG: isochorismate synthase [Prevotella sp.]
MSDAITAYACYRLPHQKEYHRVVQRGTSAETLLSAAQLKGRSGFVMAPFHPQTDCPILLFQGEHTIHSPLESGGDITLPLFFREETLDFKISPPNTQTADSSCSPEVWEKAFRTFQSALQENRFNKLVLSRHALLPHDASCDVHQLFLKACQTYPRMFVALVSARQHGTWLMATPEILLEQQDNHWRTVALAGTMPLEGELLQFDNPPQSLPADAIRWSEKNIQEQRYVASYIAECLKRFARQRTEKGPYTVRAGNIVHLRSDFTFVMKEGISVGDLLMALHPTPAVCGLPKRQAYDFIIRNEGHRRRYYSGFAGPLQTTGNGTHLYVSLRCMEIQPQHYCLYAGGGLLKESVRAQEWHETEIKMDTMRQLITSMTNKNNRLQA